MKMMVAASFYYENDGGYILLLRLHLATMEMMVAGDHGELGRTK